MSAFVLAPCLVQLLFAYEGELILVSQCREPSSEPWNQDQHVFLSHRLLILQHHLPTEPLRLFHFHRHMAAFFRRVGRIDASHSHILGLFSAVFEQVTAGFCLVTG